MSSPPKVHKKGFKPGKTFCGDTSKGKKLWTFQQQDAGLTEEQLKQTCQLCLKFDKHNAAEKQPVVQRFFITDQDVAERVEKMMTFKEADFERFMDVRNELMQDILLYYIDNKQSKLAVEAMKAFK